MGGIWTRRDIRMKAAGTWEGVAKQAAKGRGLGLLWFLYTGCIESDTAVFGDVVFFVIFFGRGSRFDATLTSRRRYFGKARTSYPNSFEAS